MKLLRCPINGLRPLQEFSYGGVVRPAPEPSTASDVQWADYVFNRDGGPGVKKEWWYHIASGTWFIAERDNQKDEFIRSYLYGEENGAGSTSGTHTGEAENAGAVGIANAAAESTSD